MLVTSEELISPRSCWPAELHSGRGLRVRGDYFAKETGLGTTGLLPTGASGLEKRRDEMRCWSLISGMCTARVRSYLVGGGLRSLKTAATNREPGGAVLYVLYVGLVGCDYTATSRQTLVTSGEAGFSLARPQSCCAVGCCTIGSLNAGTCRRLKRPQIKMTSSPHADAALRPVHATSLPVCQPVCLSIPVHQCWSLSLLLSHPRPTPTRREKLSAS